MRIKFTHSRSREYFRAQLRTGAWHEVRTTLLLAATLAVGGAFTTSSDAEDPRITALGVVAIVVAILLALRARHRFVDAVTVPPQWHRPRTWMITEDELQSHTDLSSQRWNWAAARCVEQRPEAYLFWQDGPVMFDLPRAPLSTAQETELQAHLVERGLLRPTAAVTRPAPPATDWTRA